MPAWTEARVFEALRERYPEGPWALVPQVRCFTGYGERRMYNLIGDRGKSQGYEPGTVRVRRRSTEATIDAVAIGLWKKTRYEVHGIEIKVSRSDWLAELRDPIKTEVIRRQVDRLIIAAPEGVVRPDLDAAVLGNPWGWIDIDPNGKCRMHKQPQQLGERGADLPRRFVGSLVRSAQKG